VRDLHTRLGIFLEPDPRPHGSQAGPYSYTNADPINQSDPTGLCVGWGCVKEVNTFLQPISTVLTLFACVLGFGIGCFVTSLIQLAVSVLNLTADFALHQDAAADGVTAALAAFNVAAASPILYELGNAARLADWLGVDEAAVTNALKVRSAELSLPAAERTTVTSLLRGEDFPYFFPSIESRYAETLDYQIAGAAAWRSFLVGTTIFTSAGTYAAQVTSNNWFGCCWKLW
jgi:hypothetical protein